MKSNTNWYRYKDEGFYASTTINLTLNKNGYMYRFDVRYLT